MKSNYEPLGKHIQLVDYRNSEEVTSTVLGISIDKEFMPSVANVIGTDLSRYKLISKGLFACNPMHVGRDERLPIALYEKDSPAIVSPAYFMFEIIDRDVLNEEYLMMWFRRPEFDRECWFMTDGSVRGGITWDDLCRIKLPVPSYARQCEIVESYRTITDRIALKRAENDNLAETANALFCKMFFATSIAEKCDVGTFSQLIKETIGGDWGQEQPKGNYTSKVTCIRGTDIPALNLGSISAAPTRYILPKNLSSKRITADNIVVEISGGSPVQATGRVALIPDAVLAYHKEDLICSNFCRIMNIRSEYLYFFFQYWTYLYRNGVMFNYENSSTGLKNFNFSAFITEEKIQIPPIDIARRFNATLEPIYKEIFSVGFEIEKLVEARELLLPHLMLHDFSSR